MGVPVRSHVNPKELALMTRLDKLAWNWIDMTAGVLPMYTLPKFLNVLPPEHSHRMVCSPSFCPGLMLRS